MNQYFTQITRLFLKDEIEQSIPDRFEKQVLAQNHLPMKGLIRLPIASHMQF
jgi:hypothetical protein